MKVEYSNRATSDLRKIAADSRRFFGEKVAAELGSRIEGIVDEYGAHLKVRRRSTRDQGFASCC